MYRSKVFGKSGDDATLQDERTSLTANTDVFNILVVINVLQSLIRKSNIVAQLEVGRDELLGQLEGSHALLPSISLCCDGAGVVFPAAGIPSGRQSDGGGWRLWRSPLVQDARLL